MGVPIIRRVCGTSAAVSDSERHVSDKRDPVLPRNEVVQVWAIKNKCVHVMIRRSTLASRGTKI